jgi:outer membrane protein OmpA-like peptidoglycan-associated protein
MLSRCVAACLALSLLAGCAAVPNPFTGQPQVSKTAGGAAVGAAGGAVAGALIGGVTGNDPCVGALIGAGFGALTGAGVGAYMDQQEAELRTQLRSTGVSVTRAGNQIVLNMPANITFDTDDAKVKPDFAGTLVSVAAVLKHFNRTTVDVYGYTDSQGPDDYNQALSQRRANNVAAKLSAAGVGSDAISIKAYGESSPAVQTPDGVREPLNRRVEITAQ